ncbi:MAG: alanine:cation symporter family protein [Bacteroidaceae bacterium]|nr:alanine:cation symporter family protein [Bacteroidaceae bacterium]
MTNSWTDIFAANGSLNQNILVVSDVIWTYLLVALLIGCGLYFTYKTRFVQFRMLREMIRLLTESAVTKQGEKHISSFQAFAVSVATRVGTGNLAGVATAITIGGPGSVFWMWVIALIGSASAFVESTLAQLFKQKHRDSFIGGPAYYILKGMKLKWMAALFAVLITITFGLSYNSIQSNTICSAMQQAFGFSPLWIGIVIAILALAVVFGGIHRIAKVSSVLVPLMAVGYFLLAFTVVLLNISILPEILKQIVQGAFGIEQFAGGTLGATMMTGIKRGLFSNEAGEGSAPNVAATAHTSHPVKQGLIQALGVFTDTLLVCSCTAFIILLSGAYQTTDFNGIALTQESLQSEIGSSGPIFVAVAVCLFAFSSIIGNYYYGEANIRFLTPKKSILYFYRICSAGLVVLFGAIASLDIVWNIGDVCMACLAACNLVAIICLGKYAFRLLDDYRAQKRKGIKEPVFTKDKLPEIADRIECWE